MYKRDPVKVALANRRWLITHRDQRNAYRRKVRADKQPEYKEIKCKLCEMLIRGNEPRKQSYCTDCNIRFPAKVNSDKCKRSYWKKIKAKERSTGQFTYKDKNNQRCYITYEHT